MSDIAKSLENATNYEDRWFPNRSDRRQDDKNALLAEAIKNLEERPDAIFPKATHIPAATSGPSLAGAPVTDLVLNGTNLEGDATKSTGSSENSTGVLDLEAVLPGEQTITCTITDTGAALAVSAADAAAGTIALVTGDAGGAGTAGAYTVAEVLAVINAHAEAKYMVNASEGTAGDMEADENISVAGGTGDLTSLTIGGHAIDGTNPGNGITLTTPTAITFDLDISDIDGAATALVVGDAYAFDLRVDGVQVPLPNMVPVT